MATPSNPSEIARETLKALATRKLAPTPDNYAQAYQEISGTTPAGATAINTKPLRLSSIVILSCLSDWSCLPT